MSDPWVKVSEVNWSDGETSQNPQSPISHTYNVVGNYKPSVILKNVNNATSMISCSVSSEAITISASCGNGQKEGDEECDGGAACAADCKWKKPDAETVLQKFSVTPRV